MSADFVRSSLPPAPARVLEVGAGDGALAAALAADAYDVVAIDPEPQGVNVRRVALHEVDEPPASFDAAVAVLSLHHVEPLEPSCEVLAGLVRAGGTLVVDEFDLDLLDEGVAAWWLEQRAAAGAPDERTPADVVELLRSHLHPLDRIRRALGAWFELTEPDRVPYLHRWHLPPEAEAEETRLITAGRLPATGVRFVGTRRNH